MKYVISALLCSTLVIAADIPEEGLKAEMAGNWSEAATIYTNILSKNPNNVDLYLRLSDIYAKEKQYDKASDILQQAIPYTSKPSELLSKLSTIQAINGQSKEAIISIDKALVIDPNNIHYLQQRAELSSWAGEYEKAAIIYEKLYEQHNDNNMLLHQAENLSWDGQLSKAGRIFDQYTKHEQADKAALLKYIKNEIWKGDYSHAQKLLKQYTQNFQEDSASNEAAAELYTRAEWPDHAGIYLEPALKADPSNYNLNYFNTLKLHYDHLSTKAIQSLASVQELRPNSKDTDDLRKVIMTPLRSDVSAGGFFFRDNENISIHTLSLQTKYVVKPTLSLLAEAQWDHLYTKQNSLYKNTDGSTSSNLFHGAVGVSGRPSSVFGYNVLIGSSESDNDSSLYLRSSVNIDIDDKTTVYADLNHNVYAISPLSTSLGIEQTHTALLLEYRPTLEYTILAQSEYDMYSHNNERLGFVLAPRKAILRNEIFNLDLGVKGWWFGYSKDLNNGYYDPKLFESYMGTFYSTVKITPEDEISIIGGVGYIKDNTMDSYRIGYNIDVLGTFGIYRSWMIQAKTGYMNNQRQVSGNYDAYYAGISITKRF
ncbi:tetratricopeptide repeat protein [Sulfuricurvum sp.]|uniref:tetratricopeptide repeat protein n=1 Tax=Sulfuricurvum sp. TaxID=2025608 RepID=UPI0026151844|nr:tetratricopeptide repeat protein [Sulfuricurvum sp.]MDD3597539.1 tetratricopeptide repeat protein [Sulfuricurvum sp.]